MLFRMTGLVLALILASGELAQVYALGLSAASVSTDQQIDGVTEATSDTTGVEEDGSSGSDFDLGTIPPPMAVIEGVGRALHTGCSAKVNDRELERRATSFVHGEQETRSHTSARRNRRDRATSMAIVAQPVRSHAPPLGR